MVELWLGDTGYPIGDVYALVRNYADHATEMGGSVGFHYFMKPTSSLVPGGGDLTLPAGDIHFEGEVAILILSTQPVRTAVGLALDLTRRDLQKQAKAAGMPWGIAKAFRLSCPISGLFPRETGQVHTFRLERDGQVLQEGITDQALLPPEPALKELSKHVDLQPGDLLLTGTPAGVASFGCGETLVGFLDGQEVLRVTRRPPREGDSQSFVDWAPTH